MAKEPTISDGDTIECPVCQSTFNDLWDYFDGETNLPETAEIQCPGCDADLTLQSETATRYECHAGHKPPDQGATDADTVQ